MCSDKAPKEIKAPTNKKSILFSAALIIILGFVVYGNSLNGRFIWDDELLIENNVLIKSFSNISRVFAHDIWADTGKEGNTYRPLQMVTYMIDYSLWKLNPKGYHLTNILLHISVALSIYWLINIIFKENWIALLAALFFVIHPIHTEAVTYISGRADPLALLLMLLCFIFYLKSPPSKGMGTYFLIVISYSLALISRENSLILPVLLLLYHYTFNEKIKVKELLSIVSISVVYILLRVTFLKALLSSDINDTSLLQRIPGFFVAIFNYIKLLLIKSDG